MQKSWPITTKPAFLALSMYPRISTLAYSPQRGSQSANRSRTPVELNLTAARLVWILIGIIMACKFCCTEGRLSPWS